MFGGRDEVLMTKKINSLFEFRRPSQQTDNMTVPYHLEYASFFINLRFSYEAMPVAVLTLALHTSI